MSLYYFVFELQMIKITLTATEIAESRVAQQKIKTRRVVFFLISIVYIIINNGYHLSVYFNEQDNVIVFQAFFIGARLIKVAMDFYIEILFIFLLVFFIKFRKERIGKHEFSMNNYIVLITILVLFSLCVFQSVLIFA